MSSSCPQLTRQRTTANRNARRAEAGKLELTRPCAQSIVGFGPKLRGADGPIQPSRGAPECRPTESATVSRRARSVVVVVIALAGVFAIVNGVHDAGNAIAAPVVTRAIRPGPAVVGAAALHVVGALVVGTAVAATISGIVVVPSDQMLKVLAAATLAALVWSLLTLWRGLPCSSGHCLVGALAGAGLAEGGSSAVNWGGMNGFRPVGVVGSLLWLMFSSAVVVPMALFGIHLAKRGLRRADRSIEGPVRRGELVASGGLAFAHGSNDAQKAMGLMTAALVAGGHLSHFAVPFAVAIASALLLTVGTLLGGWRVVRTLGRRIYPIQALDGLVSQSSVSYTHLTLPTIYSV